MVEIDRDLFVSAGLYRSGPVEDIILTESVLLTSGGENPIDVYSLKNSESPSLLYSMFDDVRFAQAMEFEGDTLIAYFARLNRLAFVLNSLDPDSFYVDRAFSLQDSLAGNIYLLPEKIDTVRILAAEGLFRTELFAINDSGEVSSVASWSFPGRITAGTGIRGHLATAVSKRQIWVNEIRSDFTPRTVSVIDLASPCYELVESHGKLLAFAGMEAIVYDVLDGADGEIEARIPLPITVTASALHGDDLWVIGPEGIGLMSLSDSLPVFLGMAGLGGRGIVVNDFAVATEESTDAAEGLDQQQRRAADDDTRGHDPPEMSAVATPHGAPNGGRDDGSGEWREEEDEPTRHRNHRNDTGDGA